MTDVITAQISTALSFSEPCWFPGLSKLLLQSWSKNALADSWDYGTSRLIGGPGCSPRWVQAVGVEKGRLTNLEVLSPLVEAPYQALGLNFLTAQEVAEAPRETFYEALSTAAMPASLLSCVTDLAKSTHLMRSAGAGMDISHSDPALPFSVFLSVPAAHERFAALRLAEGFIHETMHLQLSLIERVIPMIHDNDLTYFSPWRSGHRPVRGVLHGLYVFAVIQQWLALRGPTCIYAQRRLPEIGKELAELAGFANADGLTLAGAQFAQRLIDSAFPTPVGACKYGDNLTVTG